ncbi:thiamine-binding protein [Dactylosporangium sp. CA-052675]|uniref:thiamine-binding protein n=1 Tax=Dactylosporangium sp. CA-052675 TaxID=3239927 RepID=UPI003D8E217E
MSVLVAFSVTPLGLGEDVGALVAEAVRVVRASGLPNRTDAMFTTVEGSTWEEVMAVVQAAVAVVQSAAPRTSTVIKVDWRDGPVGRLESKVATVEQHLAAG